MFMSGLDLNIYGFHYSVNMCMLQLGVTFKVCVVKRNFLLPG